MKAISIRNPWAAWIVHRFKTVETRTHAQFSKHVDNPVAIHCSKAMPISYLNWSVNHANRYVAAAKMNAWIKFLQNHDFKADLGCVLGTAWLNNHFWISNERWDKAALCAARETYGLQFDVLTTFEQPIPAKGALYMWNWTPPASVPS